MLRQLEFGRQLSESILLPERHDYDDHNYDDVDEQFRLCLYGVGQWELWRVRGAACLPDGYLCSRQLRLPEGHAGLLHVERKQYDELYDQCLHKCGHRVFLLHFERLRDRLRTAYESGQRLRNEPLLLQADQCYHFWKHQLYFYRHDQFFEYDEFEWRVDIRL